MDNRERQLRIERMKREKARQLRTRRQREKIIRRMLIVGGGVAAILVVIALIWMLIGPLVKKSGADKTVDQTVAEAQVDGQNDAEVDKAVDTQKDKTDAVAKDDEADDEKDESQEDESTDEVVTEQPTQEDSDQPAVKAAITESRAVEYAVPGWQIDNQGWWYANEDNTYLKNGWLEIDSKQYHLDEDGYMQTGWNAVGQKGHYFTETGEYVPDKESKMVAMTFDDGPGEYTNHLLDILEENNAKATFFMLGTCVENYGEDTIPRMQQLGCELGNHSYDHSNLTQLNAEQVKEQFDKTDDLISAITGGDISTVARTPYGAQDETITGYIGKPCMYWNLDTEDWKTKDVQNNISVVMDHVTDGDIILMHDIHKATVESCETIISELVKEGFQLVTVSELAQAKGINMKDGVTYYDFVDSTVAAMNEKADGASEEETTETSEEETSEEETEED